MSKTYQRNCPICCRVITYNGYSGWYQGNRNNSQCKDCKYKHQSGKYNCWFGKKLPKSVRRKISQSLKNTLRIYWTEERRKKHADACRDKCYKIKNYYQDWIKKYGKREADRRMKLKKKRHSITSSGKNNGMYGKPPPQGSGNGWSGWYKGWYFRSIHELSFMINHIEKNKWSWRSGEAKEYQIQYIDHNNKERTYYPDFIINSEIMIECKPKKLHLSPLVLCKKQAAENFCKTRGLQYKIIAPILLTQEELIELHDTQKICFLDRYEKKYQEKFKSLEI